MASHGWVESRIGYVGDNVETDVDEMVAQVRQRALVATWQRRGTPDDAAPWWEGYVVDDDGEATRVAAGHVDPDAPDADAWGIVDGRLPHEEPSP